MKQKRKTQSIEVKKAQEGLKRKLFSKIDLLQAREALAEVNFQIKKAEMELQIAEEGITIDLEGEAP